MRINDKIVRAYLQGEDMGAYRNEWYFTHSCVARDAGRNIYTEPENTERFHRQVKEMYELFFAVVEGFQPLNSCVFDALFPEWRDELEMLNVDLILGFPKPYDATVQVDDAGISHVMFDLGVWTNYIGKVNMKEVITNLLTHEFCHHVLEHAMPEVLEDEAGTEYLSVLDAVTFDEGLAKRCSE